MCMMTLKDWNDSLEYRNVKTSFASEHEYYVLCQSEGATYELFYDRNDIDSLYDEVVNGTVEIDTVVMWNGFAMDKYAFCKLIEERRAYKHKMTVRKLFMF